ncbi:hypothetical protein LZ31DRAFT_597494 [Colletotrichum somersetense]|nr:hypothetical protein LZ31DRAFT_597494 [Colletotrichum somersetense]
MSIAYLPGAALIDEQGSKQTPELLQGSLNIEKARGIINSELDELNSSLHNEINKVLHANPETVCKEFFAHDTITNYLEMHGFTVKRHAYGLETSFEAEIGSGRRQVVVCAEYDALPEIGHACSHNLIATSSVAAFLGASRVLSTLKAPGRLRILGTPAEEGGGGKAKLIDAGTFSPPEDIAAAIMAHPIRAAVEMDPQQIQSDERIHGVIEVGGTVTNVITDYTRMTWNVRSPTIDRADDLLERVKACLEAGAAATGCNINYVVSPTYMNLRANDTLCKMYVEEMEAIGETIQLHQAKPFNVSTDMGNVSHLVPSFHGAGCSN